MAEMRTQNQCRLYPQKGRPTTAAQKSHPTNPLLRVQGPLAGGPGQGAEVGPVPAGVPEGNHTLVL
jgi:hypothetical protein